MPFHCLNCGVAALKNLGNSIEKSWKLLHKSLSVLCSHPGAFWKPRWVREDYGKRNSHSIVTRQNCIFMESLCEHLLSSFPCMFSKYFSSLILQASCSCPLIGHDLGLRCVPRLPSYLVHFHVNSRLSCEDEANVLPQN